MSLADWSPIATHAISHGRTAEWFTSPRPTYLITCDDGIHTALYWTGTDWSGTDWSGSSADALEFSRREDAELELRAARDSINDKRRELVAVEEF